MHQYISLRLMGVFLLIAANAFFVAAEFALITVPRTRVRSLVDAGVTGARALVRLQDHLDTLLSATQLGVTLAALGLGWAAEPVFMGLFAPFINFNALPPAARGAVHGLVTAAGFLVITFLDVVIGEVAPKSLALRYTERLALATALPMEAFASFTRPFLRVIAAGARLVLRPFATGAVVGTERVHSPEELKLLVTASLQLGQLSAFQEEVIQRVLDLHQVPVREIMTPRHEVLALPVQTPIESALQFIVEHPRSRFPVYEGDLDHTIGLLYAKDLLRVLTVGMLRPGLATRNLRTLLRPLRVVPESKPLDQLLFEFQHGRVHLSAVVDEFGTLTGLVTVEDILEELVGEVQDEYDTAEPLAPLLGHEPAAIDGLSSIRDLEAQYGIEFPRDDNYETLAGFLLLRLGHIPRTGEQVELGPFRFTVLSMDGNRINQVRVERIPAPAPSTNAG